jgi:phosphatidylserine/phosphatidylglycerophosphate/cardiolipin synthase-like enzyme
MLRRALLAFELGANPGAARELAVGLAASPENVSLVARIPDERARGLIEGSADESSSSGRREAGAPPTIALGLSAAAIAADTIDADADLLVLGPFPTLERAALAHVAFEAAQRLAIPVLVSGPEPGRAAPPRRIVALFDNRLELAALGAFARDHADAKDEVILLGVGEHRELEPAEVPAIGELVGIPCAVSLEYLRELRWSLGARVAALAREREAALVALPYDLAGVSPVPGLTGRGLLAQSRLPVLLLPPVPSGAREPGALDAPDAVVVGSGTTLLVEQIDWLRRAHPVSGDLLVVGEGVPSRVRSSAGEAPIVLESRREGAHLVTLGRESTGVIDPLIAAETHLRLVRPGAKRLTLFDARLDAANLATVRAALEAAPGPRLAAAVRLESSERASAIRARLFAAGFAEPLVLDARQVLDEGQPDDVLPMLRDVRLARVAARLRSNGVAVDSIVVGGEHAPAGHGFRVVRASEIQTLAQSIDSAFTPPLKRSSVRADRLDQAAASTALPGHRARVHFDNLAARTALERFIAEAQERVHIQVYIASDDPVTAEIERALVQAARRGVSVRVLADSLVSLHDSFGATNSLLARLGAEPRIEVRAIHPVSGVPDVRDMKQRDHRKLVIQDGRLAVVTGRNLARHYYLGFQEVRLRPESPWWEVPWLDAGVELEGPQVARVEGAFLESWIAAGGAPFPVRDVSPSGEATLRVVIHQGLFDARTLEAYLALIDTAVERLVVVNAFPLHLEIQHAFLRALARGVSLTFLTGNARPHHGSGSFSGGSIRELATDLVMSRLDPLIDAGASVHEFSLAGIPGWDPSLGAVRPYVHAKVLIADGDVAAVGSANLDVTASYWESEALVVLEDAELSLALERDVARLVAGSSRIERDDPRRARRASRRGFLARHWPTGILG